MGEDYRIGLESLASFISEQLSPSILTEILRDGFMREVQSYVKNYINNEVENLVSTLVKKEVESLRQQCNLALENLTKQLQETLSALNRQSSPIIQKEPGIKQNPNPFVFSNPSIPDPILSRSIPTLNPDSGSDNYPNIPGMQKIQVSSNTADKIKELFRANNYTEGFKLFLDNDDEKTRQCLSCVNFESLNRGNFDMTIAERLGLWAITNAYLDFLGKLIYCVDGEVLRKLLRKIVNLKDPSYQSIKSAIIKILG